MRRRAGLFRGYRGNYPAQRRVVFSYDGLVARLYISKYHGYVLEQYRTMVVFLDFNVRG